MNLQRYRFLNMVATCLALGLALVLLLADRWYVDRDYLLENLEVQASLIGGNAVAALAFNDQATALEIVGTATRSPMVLEAALYRADGQQLAHYVRQGAQPVIGPTPGPFGHWFSFADLLIHKPIVLGNQTMGSIALRSELSGLYQALTRFLFGLLAIVAISLVFGQLASRKIRRRMHEAEEAMQRMALYDRVSKLGNRYSFEQALELIIARHGRDNQGSALLFIDVDGFKKVNDMLGHHGGDQVLASIGERLKQSLRASDVVARVGGDEFGVILVDTSDPGAAAQVAENLIRIASHPFQVEGVTIHIGFSIGIALIPRDGTEKNVLMHHADLAMYQAKQHGKGRHQFFSDEIGAAVHRRHKIEAELRLALKHDQLYMVYQPQIACSNQEIRGLEALVRWHHPERGLISPAEFIPVAEESGLILELGRKILHLVCQDIAEMKRAGCRPPPVAINISARQFMLSAVSQDIEEALGLQGLQPADIELELTESVLMERLEAQQGVLDDLSRAGFRLAIDDFGTGYSSLSYLKQLQVDKLKIDMSFIKPLPDDGDSLAIVIGIISMAHSVGLTVVAEGVEHQAQYECLMAHDCDLIQGYYTGRPMEKAALVEYLVA